MAGCSSDDSDGAPAPEPGSSSIRLNEVLFYPAEGPEWVELYNPATEPADIGSFAITGDRGEAYVIPAALPAVPPGGYVLILLDGLPASRNDCDFADGTAVLHGGAKSGDVFDDLADTCAVRTGGQGDSSTVIDFVAWGDYAYRGQYVRNVEEYGGHGPVGAGRSVGLHPEVYDVGARPQWVIYGPGESTPGERNPIPAPVPETPAQDAALGGNTVSFAWSDWYLNIQAYDLEVDDQEDFAAPEISVRTEAPVHHSEVRLFGRYYWRVKAVTADLEESAWSAIRSFEIGGAPSFGLLASKDLNATPLIHRRDTYLLCPACEESGEHSWNAPHSGSVESIQKCPHCNTYCGRASVAMVNHYYGGNVSQDRVSYAAYGPALDPETELGHGKGFSGDAIVEALAWAIEGSPQVLPEDFSFEKVVQYIDEGRILIGAIPGTPLSNGHVVVIDGYDDYTDDADDTMHVLQPYTGKQELVKKKETKIEFLFAPPAGSRGIREENLSADYDLDGVVDFDEMYRFHSHPWHGDTDGDGIYDLTEIWSWVWGKGIETRRPYKGWNIWLMPNYDGDAFGDGEEDLNRNGNMEQGECDPFVADPPFLVKLKLAGADGGSPYLEIGGQLVARIAATGNAAGYQGREVQFLPCGTLVTGAKLTIRAVAGRGDGATTRDSWDDIQVRDIRVTDATGTDVLLNAPGPFHLGNDSLAAIQQATEEGKWFDPNPLGFWAELYGTSVSLGFARNE